MVFYCTVCGAECDDEYSAKHHFWYGNFFDGVSSFYCDPSNFGKPKHLRSDFLPGFREWLVHGKIKDKVITWKTNCYMRDVWGIG